MVNETLRLVIGAIIRWLLIVSCGYGVAMNLEHNGSIGEFFALCFGGMAGFVWSVIQKLRTVFVIDEALRLPARSSFDDLKRMIH